MRFVQRVPFLKPEKSDTPNSPMPRSSSELSGLSRGSPERPCGSSVLRSERATHRAPGCPNLKSEVFKAGSDSHLHAGTGVPTGIPGHGSRGGARADSLTTVLPQPNQRDGEHSGKLHASSRAPEARRWKQLVSVRLLLWLRASRPSEAPASRATPRAS